MLQGSLWYDTVKFFAERIPCNCLKEIYSRAKSEPKLVYCQNCKKGKDRKHMFLCGGCMWAHYCSVECQEAHYSSHCSLCKNLVWGKKITGWQSGAPNDVELYGGQFFDLLSLHQIRDARVGLHRRLQQWHIRWSIIRWVQVIHSICSDDSRTSECLIRF